MSDLLAVESENRIALKTPYSDLLPPLSTEEFAALEADIRANGVREAVVVDEVGNVLDGHHRLKIDPDASRRVVSGLTDDEKQAFVIRANMARRNLSPSQKQELLAKQKALAGRLREAGKTQEEVAVLLGVARQTVGYWEGPAPVPVISNANLGITDNTPAEPPALPKPDVRVKVNPVQRPVIAQRVQAGESQAQVAADYGVKQNTVSTIVAKETKRQEAVQRRREVAARIDSDLGIHHGDFREIGFLVADNSVDLIFTDPPYDGASVSLYADLAEFGARVLKPGSWCLAYSGHTFLPQALAAMQKHLRYGWVFCVLHTGGALRYRNLRLQNGWKPILGFYKPPSEAWWEWFPDVVSGGKEKDAHPWQQAVGEAEHFIRNLTLENNLVCDPFCGGGTTCLAAKRLGRVWVAFEKDAEHVVTARVRIHDSS